MESLTGYSAFVLAAEQHSYVAAGRILGISSSAVAKSISRLEAGLGVRLLSRTTRSVGLTDEGAIFYERCKRILDDIRDAEATVSQSRERPKGRLRVSVPHIVGRHLLLPHLATFTQRFPEIELDINFEDRVVDIVAEGLDVAVRSGELTDTRLIARSIGKQHFVVCGSATYFNHYNRPETPTELGRHICIHFKYPSSGRLAPWSFRPPYGDLRLPESMIFNNTDAGLYASIDGIGLAHLPVYVARPAIEAGVLKPVLADFMLPFGSLSLVWPSNRQLSPKVRAFVDFAIERLQANSKAFLPIEAR